VIPAPAAAAAAKVLAGSGVGRAAAAGAALAGVAGAGLVVVVVVDISSWLVFRLGMSMLVAKLAMCCCADLFPAKQKHKQRTKISHKE
jgi:hypothetical protein